MKTFDNLLHLSHKVKGVNAFGIMKNPEKGEIKSQKESVITTMQDFLPLYPWKKQYILQYLNYTSLPYIKNKEEISFPT